MSSDRFQLINRYLNADSTNMQLLVGPPTTGEGIPSLFYCAFGDARGGGRGELRIRGIRPVRRAGGCAIEDRRLIITEHPPAACCMCGTFREKRMTDQYFTPHAEPSAEHRRRCRRQTAAEVSPRRVISSRLASERATRVWHRSSVLVVVLLLDAAEVLLLQVSYRRVRSYPPMSRPRDHRRASNVLMRDRARAGQHEK